MELNSFSSMGLRMVARAASSSETCCNASSPPNANAKAFSPVAWLDCESLLLDVCVAIDLFEVCTEIDCWLDGWLDNEKVGWSAKFLGCVEDTERMLSIRFRNSQAPCPRRWWMEGS